MPYNKGDFTQQGVAGYVNGGLLLNNKRDVTTRISTDEESAGIDSVDIKIKDRLNDIEYHITGENLSEGENVIGGGDSSLFTTAKVTIINNKSEDILLKLPVYHIGEEIGMFITGDAPIGASETYTYDAIIPASSGMTALTKEPQISENSIEITGDAEYLGGMVAITGDCTITFKA